MLAEAVPKAATEDGRTAARRGPETRTAIDRAAVALFARRGYHATSMREIAASAGVQPAAIYHWYPSKEAILIGLQDDFMERLTAEVVAARDRQTRPALRLAAAVREHVVFHGLHRPYDGRDASVNELLGLPDREAAVEEDQPQALLGGEKREEASAVSLRGGAGLVFQQKLKTAGMASKMEKGDPPPVLRFLESVKNLA